MEAQQPKSLLPSAPPESSNFGWQELASLIVALVISALIFAFRDSLHQLEGWGYAGVFLVALLGNATLVLPMPALVFVFVAGGTLGSPLLVGLLSGVGATLGEFTGYLAGYSGNKFVAHTRPYQKVRDKVARYGLAVIVLLAFIPSPLFDLAGMAAGALKIRPHKFMGATLLGKTLKMILIAYAGSLSIRWVERLLS